MQFPWSLKLAALREYLHFLIQRRKGNLGCFLNFATKLLNNTKINDKRFLFKREKQMRKTLLRLQILVYLLICSCCYGNNRSEFFHYQYALVRDISSSFEKSLKLEPPPTPINMNLAKQQHDHYIAVLEALIPTVIRLGGDPHHPDCNFIEDTAIVVDDIAVICRMGALERRGEQTAVAEALEDLGMRTIHLQAPCTMDGGDILYTGKHLFVGLSRRTNVQALTELQALFKGKVEVVGIPVLEGLHLKSIISFFDTETLIIAETAAGKAVRKQIEQSTDYEYTFISVPDQVASNVLRVGSSLVVQDGFPESEIILQELCSKNNVDLITLRMSELIKADGALTCGSILFN